MQPVVQLVVSQRVFARLVISIMAVLAVSHVLVMVAYYQDFIANDRK